MSIKQISVLIENKMGSLAEVTDFLAKSNVNLRALSIADTADFGILRIITDNPNNTRDILRAKGYTVKATSVLAVAIKDKPGAMANVLTILNDAEITVEYAYAFTPNTPDKAYVILRVDNNDKACEVLSDKNIRILSQDDIFND